MPQKYAIKQLEPESYCHIFIEGAGGQAIFRDQADYQYFISLFSRYLDRTINRRDLGRAYPHYWRDIELAAYALMTRQLHIVAYIRQPDALQALMRSLLTSYARYFNRRHKRSGAVFSSRYKARIIPAEYVPAVSRFVHRSPRNWQTYRHSSLAFFIDTSPPGWLAPRHVAGYFATPYAYASYMEHDAEAGEWRAALKEQLAI
ncbi:hypothetical protein JNJ66_05845 [Candidatus Saccharibacteria bacterium]|nr:hypothetical protein [Candidatus Saccharibacteria bacterium]